MEINKFQKKYLLQFQKVLMMELRIRLAGKGEAGSRGGANGDLYLFINVKSHELFKRSDENLFFEFPISIADAALGTTIEIPTIDGGKAKIKIPEGTQSGKQFRLRGKGMPYMRGKWNW
jgi:molecular chaperone DnaJ